MSKNILIALIMLVTVSIVGCSSQDYFAKNNTGPNAKSHAVGRFGRVSKIIASSSHDLRKQRIVYFGFDKANVNASDLAVINAHARFLKLHPATRITLEGHTDERGSPEYNIGLGERRGKAIANLLKAKGVQSAQIHLVSYGKEKPAVLGHTENAYSKNRRVEIRYENS